MAKIAIGTNDLLLNYPLSGRHFALTQLNAMTILDQSYLDASAIGTEIALKIKSYQRQMNTCSIDYSNNVLSRYAVLVSTGLNISKFIQAYIGIEADKITESLYNPTDKQDLLNATQSLVDTSDELSFSLQLLKTEMELIKLTFEEIQKNYDATLSQIIEEGGARVQLLNGEIKVLNDKIAEDIDNIVQGGKDLADGLNQLGQGVLTTVANIPSEKKEKKEKALLKKKEDKPDPNFAIEAINLSAEGAAKGSKATKDLKINNAALAALYQDLSGTQAIISVAIAIRVQNDFFINSFEKGHNDSLKLEQDWNGVSESCCSLKINIAQLEDETAARTLRKEVMDSLKHWAELDKQLQKIKSALTGT